MLNKDMFNNPRFYVRGERDDLERFTIDLTWYHSALAEIGSIVDHEDGKITLNLILKNEDGGATLRALAAKFNTIGFASFDELRGS